MSATIRRYRDSDWAAVYQVCVETADSGRGVRGRYSTDDLVPDTVAGPYLFLGPSTPTCWTMASAPSATHRHGQHPGLRRRVSATVAAAAAGPVPAAVRPAGTEEEHRLDVMFHPQRWLLPELAPHPAHLHINLLADYRRLATGGADQHIPGLGGGRRGAVMLPRRPPEEPECQALLRQARLAPGPGPRAEPGTYLVHPTG